MSSSETMTQVAPYPEPLAQLIEGLKYKPGFRFSLQTLDRGQGSAGLTLVITITAPDTYHPEQTIRVAHYMLVPGRGVLRRSGECAGGRNLHLAVDRCQLRRLHDVPHPRSPCRRMARD
jgi:hypothetical protein